MRIFTISDLHIDFGENKRWLYSLSRNNYREDTLILAGDLTDVKHEFKKALEFLKTCFKEICFIPGNHDLWVTRDQTEYSTEKFSQIMNICQEFEIHTSPVKMGNLSIVPLFSWYDYSFAPLSEKLKNAWTDFKACVWPVDYNEIVITNYFLSLNRITADIQNEYVISFSHFLPRIDLMPFFIPQDKRLVFPVLGTSLLDEQIRQIGSNMHIYGHSHVNRQVIIDKISYINNAFGYPHETRITSKKLLCVYDCESKSALNVSDKVGNRAN